MKDKKLIIKIWALVLLSILILNTTGNCADQKPVNPPLPSGKIGIFDLTAIHAVPLDPEIISHKEDATTVTEEVRFTSTPGVRVFGYFSYPKVGKKLEGVLTVRFQGAESRKSDAQYGMVGFSISAPSGNTDETKKDTIGGVPLSSDFVDDPTQSWIYQHVVALTRALDYMQSRPEVDINRTIIMGYSWGGYVTTLLHAIDNRPCAYITWHGTGYYSDDAGMSGDEPTLIKSKKYYDMYAPSAYAKYGSKPIFIATALTDYFATLDGLISMYNQLKCPKFLSVAPNRYHANTSRDEFHGTGNWALYWQSKGSTPPKITEGTVANRNGHIFYTFKTDTTFPILNSEVMYSYGKPGHWQGRTWHRIPATKIDISNSYECEIPVYNQAVPFYCLAQYETKDFGGIANGPQYVEPDKLGIRRANADYPKMLINFEDKSDLYIAHGIPTFVAGDAAEGTTSASIKPSYEGTVQFLNIEPFLWKNPREILFFLKGDGQPGPINVYLTYNTLYWLDIPSKNYKKYTLVPEGKVFPNKWTEYTLSLYNIENLDISDALFFDMGDRTLNIDGIRWR
ncbi:MAG: hypothetical protein WCO98_06750 [bacterium]